MKCPRCYGQTTVEVSVFDRHGNFVTGCPSCIYTGERRRTRRVRTNRKIWPAYEVYGKNKTIEKNHLWMEGLQRRAAEGRRNVTTVSPEAWKRLTGHD